MEAAQNAVGIVMGIFAWIGCGAGSYAIMREGVKRTYESWDSSDRQVCTLVGLAGPFALIGSLIWWFITMPPEPDESEEGKS